MSSSAPTPPCSNAAANSASNMGSSTGSVKMAASAGHSFAQCATKLCRCFS